MAYNKDVRVRTFTECTSCRVKIRVLLILLKKIILLLKTISGYYVLALLRRIKKSEILPSNDQSMILIHQRSWTHHIHSHFRGKRGIRK
jgi:hypothetical protein